MNKVSTHDAFVGQGCAGRIAPAPAVSAEAGAMWIDLYDAVTEKGGRYVQGGGCFTVGVAGLTLGGGFGSYSKRFGTAAAGLLEAEIVTADGHVRVVNACTEPDLFWALKGGGGGTFGVVTRLTLRTHELPKYFGGAGGKVTAHSDAAFKQLIERFIGFYRERLFNPHWGENVHFQPDNTLDVEMACEGLDGAQIAEIWRPFFDWVTARPQDFTVTDRMWTQARDARSQWDPSSHGFKHDPRDGVPKHHVYNGGNEYECGAFLYGYDSLWLPASLLDESRQKGLTAALFTASRHEMVRLHINKGMAGARPEVLSEVSQTATNPALLEAFTLAVVADLDEMPAYPGFKREPMDMAKACDKARGIALAAAELRKVAPHSGSYVNECSFFNTSWQHDFWGKNYLKLRSIKTKYDPTVSSSSTMASAAKSGAPTALRVLPSLISQFSNITPSARKPYVGLLSRKPVYTVESLIRRKRSCLVRLLDNSKATILLSSRRALRTAVQIGKTLLTARSRSRMIGRISHSLMPNGP